MYETAYTKPLRFIFLLSLILSFTLLSRYNISTSAKILNNGNDQYRNSQQTKTPSQGSVVISQRYGDLQTEKTAKASWYDRSVCSGRIYGTTCRTANGEVFNEDSHTMACSNDIPLNSYFQLCYLDKCIEAKCTDRGNFAKYDRKFDLSLGVFKYLSNPSVGVIKVSYIKIK